VDVEAGREEDCMSVSTMRRGAVEGSEQRATEPKIHKFILGIFRFCSLIHNWMPVQPVIGFPLSHSSLAVHRWIHSHLNRILA